MARRHAVGTAIRDSLTRTETPTELIPVGRGDARVANTLVDYRGLA